MNIHDIERFTAMLVERGYKRETNAVAINRAQEQWWRAFGRTADGYRHYTCVLNVYDRSGYRGFDTERFGRWAIEMVMKVNHQTTVDVDFIELQVMKEGMDVEDFERRCALLYPAFEKVWAREEPTNKVEG